VDFAAISLHNKLFDILQNCFQANKLAYLTLTPKKTRGLEEEERDHKDGKKKPKWVEEGDKDKFQYKDLSTMVWKNSQLMDWKFTGGKYKVVLTKDTIVFTPPPTPLLMTKVSSRATNGMLNASVMINVTIKDLTKICIFLAQSKC
jgi:hypothetical protein